MSTVIANKWINTQGVPMNSVLQVVHVEYTTVESTSSTTLTASGFTASITPKFNNSKIYVMCLPLLVGGPNAAVRFRLRRTATGTTTSYAYFATGTGIGTGSGVGVNGVHYNNTTTASMPANLSCYWLDDVQTTNACTYTVEYAGNEASTVYMNQYGAYSDWRGVSFMTLMEIAQ